MTIKISILSLMAAAFLLFPLSSVAFIETAPSVGVQGGLSLSTINAPSNVSTSDITGFGAGVVLEFPLTESLYIEPEATFVQRGASIADSGAVKVRIKMNTIEVPVFLKAKLGQVARPVFFVGPNFAFNVSSKVETEVAGTTSSVGFEPNTMDVGGVVGGGIEVGGFFANLRYMVGFTQLNKNSADWKSRGFLFLAGLKL